MQENMKVIFIILAIIVFLLSIYLGFLLNKLKIQKKLNEESKKQLEEFTIKREASIKESILILCRAVINKQCEVSEGCLRIKKLMELIDIEVELYEFGSIEKMYEQIKDFAILDERNALSKQEKFNQDKKRFSIENEYAEDVKKACKELLAALQQ